jgi:hypothetical protein
MWGGLDGHKTVSCTGDKLKEVKESFYWYFRAFTASM